MASGHIDDIGSYTGNCILHSVCDDALKVYSSSSLTADERKQLFTSEVQKVLYDDEKCGM
jgi:hypothetical protein